MAVFQESLCLKMKLVVVALSAEAAGKRLRADAQVARRVTRQVIETLQKLDAK
jgi:hypothetical protein